MGDWTPRTVSAIDRWLTRIGVVILIIAIVMLVKVVLEGPF